MNSDAGITGGTLPRGSRSVPKAPEQFRQPSRINRLGEGIVESRGEGPFTVVFLAPSGDRDQPRVFTESTGPHPAGNLVAIEPWHADVKEHDVRTKILEGGKRSRSIVHGSHGATFHP